MDSKRKKIEVNASSLVELKAELFRKEEELRQRKPHNVSADARASKPLTSKKGFVWSKKNAGSIEKAQEELAEKIEEVDAFDQAKKALAAKANLYEKLTKGDFVPEEDGSQLYLVDFQQKAIVTIADKRRTCPSVGQGGNSAEEEKKEEDLEERNSLAVDDGSHNANCPEEEWVDYVDSLGRSRRCMKKDLASLKEMDRELSGTRPKLSEDELELMSSDMKRELEREQWEKEAQMELEGPSGPVHYSNVQFNEVRDHGVGFFGFAKDEETRQQQLDALKELRDQTRSQREKHDRLKEKRKQMLDARLEKVKQRRIVKDTVSSIDLDPMTFEDKDKEKELEPKQDIEPEQIVRDDSWRKNAPVREWDKHKNPVFDQESWLEKQRKERIQEFAPPVLYELQQKLPSHNKRSKFIHREQPSLKKKPVTSVDERDTSALPFEEKLSGSSFNMTNSGSYVSSPCNVAQEKLPSVDKGAAEVGLEMTHDNISAIPLPNTDLAERSVPVNLHIPGQGPSIPSSCYSVLPPGHFQQHMQLVGYNWPEISMGDSLLSTASVVGQEHSVLPLQTVSNFSESPEQRYAVEPSEGHGQADVTTDSQSQSSRTDSGEPQLDETGYVAPQPAHFCSAPMKPQPRGPKYHAVNLHEVPLSLPEPPSANFVPHYPSQEEIILLRKAAKGEKSEQVTIKDWYRQFDQKRRAPFGIGNASKPAMKSSAGTLLRPSTIPFASRYIQRVDGQSTEDPAAAIFDPAKPPPTLNSQ